MRTGVTLWMCCAGSVYVRLGGCGAGREGSCCGVCVCVCVCVVIVVVEVVVLFECVCLSWCVASP